MRGVFFIHIYTHYKVANISYFIDFQLFNLKMVVSYQKFYNMIQSLLTYFILRNNS